MASIRPSDWVRSVASCLVLPGRGMFAPHHSPSWRGLVTSQIPSCPHRCRYEKVACILGSAARLPPLPVPTRSLCPAQPQPAISSPPHRALYAPGFSSRRSAFEAGRRPARPCRFRAPPVVILCSQDTGTGRLPGLAIMASLLSAVFRCPPSCCFPDSLGGRLCSSSMIPSRRRVAFSGWRTSSWRTLAQRPQCSLYLGPRPVLCEQGKGTLARPSFESSPRA